MERREFLKRTGVVVLAAAGGQQANAEEMADFETIHTRLAAAVLAAKEPLGDVSAYSASLTPGGTWPDIDYTDRTNGSWKPTRHLDRLVSMTRVYRTNGHPLQNNRALKATILRGLDGWFTVLPKSAKHPFGTPESDNWWHNEFGAVTKLENVWILLSGELDAAHASRLLPVLHRPWDMNGKTGGARDKGDNLLVRTFITMRLACLTRDAALMREVVARTVGELKFSTGEGLHRDYSFRAHDLFYSMHYGLGYILHPADTLRAVRGTRFAPPLESLKILSDYVLEGHQWLFRKGWMDYATTGRAIAETSYQSRRQRRALDAYALLLGLDAPRRPEIEAFMRRIERDTDDGEPVGNRHFWRADFMTHKRPAYHVSVRMASRRLKATELINQQGLQGFYMADGVMSLQRTGPEYADLMPVWNWTRLPGVTCRAGSRPPDIAPPERWGSGGHLQGVGEFVGGVSNGVCGAAVFDYAKHDVSARKSWFFFDREIVCLGSGITSPSTDVVRTSINQCHLTRDVSVSADGVAVTPARGERPLPGVSWVHHDRVGYVFPGPSASVVLKNEAQTGSWRRVHGESPETPVTADVFSLWLDHGKQPQNAEYAYVIVPDIAAGEIAAYARNAPFRILANTTKLQAVNSASEGVTGAIFFEPGTLTAQNGLRMRVDQPCALLLRERDGAASISVSNPKQEAIRVTVDLGPRRIVFDLPGGEYAGQTVTQTLTNSPKQALGRSDQ